MGRTECVECKEGFFCDGEGYAQECEAGTYQDKKEKSVCNACGKNNLYSNKDVGFVTCSTCDAGYHTAESGSGPSNRVDCIKCEKGEACDGRGGMVYCSLGQYQDKEMSDKCNMCPTGWFQDNEVNGEAGNADGFAISRDTIKEEDKNLQCKECGDRTKYTSEEGSHECATCEIGFYTTFEKGSWTDSPS